MRMDFEKLSGLGIGTWGIGEDPKKKKDEIAAIRYGLDNGLNIIDTAEMYGDGKSEKLIGEAIRDYDRDQLFLISKFYPYHATPELERKSLEASLERLGTDYLDLYLLHWRGNHRLSDTIRGLQALQKEGLIRHWGVSNFDTSDMKVLFGVPGGTECFANEDLYNIKERGTEFDLQDWQKDHGVSFIGYSPFNSGAGDTIRITQNLKIVARDHGVTPHQIMLAWTLRNGNVLAIPKSSSIKHMKENIAAQEIKLTDDELRLINSDFPIPTEKTPLAVI
ncbi:Aldo-keto reductase IolS [Lactobacillus helveticus]|uniref:Aldo-keto reductase IolS n=3 Tax=Lactobacillales TaxID=186826 RepID=A0A9Q5C4L4_LACHE|nr:Aldo-keto reductase IolS [Lactobacillus helveticus]NRN93808.1 Aldo-keto reductase IolS [Lactobacillus helveticus]NRO06369.1 Aldo-keto reductase IolS [Lactobacillus helveticus]NRO22402.1 Aldo-keto reductase IolS [Lactobacillus helveticus]NRO26721.1 Aldo-keto reductase IolS [Lactobacillus helveticus]